MGDFAFFFSVFWNFRGLGSVPPEFRRKRDLDEPLLTAMAQILQPLIFLFPHFDLSLFEFPGAFPAAGTMSHANSIPASGPEGPKNSSVGTEGLQTSWVSSLVLAHHI